VTHRHHLWSGTVQDIGGRTGEIITWLTSGKQTRSISRKRRRVVRLKPEFLQANPIGIILSSIALSCFHHKIPELKMSPTWLDAKEAICQESVEKLLLHLKLQFAAFCAQ